MWIARGIAEENYDLDKLPEVSEIPPHIVAQSDAGQVRTILPHWTRLLCLIRDRPKECGRVIIRALQDAGIPNAGISRALRLIAPDLTVHGEALPRDPDYVDLELQHLTSPTYGLKIAIAYRAARYNITFAYDMAVRALNQSPDRSDADLCLAELSERVGNYKRACKYYENAVTKGARGCRTKWAQAANLAQMPETALQITQSAGIETSPEILLEKARALRQLDKNDEALRVYQSINMQHLPDALQARSEMAEVMYTLDRFDMAIRTAHLPAKRGDAIAQRVLAFSSYRQNDWAQAALWLQRYCRKKADDAEAWSVLSECQFRLGNDQLAIHAARRALQIDNSDEHSAGLLAASLVRQSDVDEALAVCHAHGWRILPLTYLTRLLIDAGQLTEAAELFGIWVERQPNDRNVWLYGGYIAELLHHYEDALRYYGEAHRRAPRDRFIQRRYQRLRRAFELGLFDNKERGKRTLNNNLEL